MFNYPFADDPATPAAVPPAASAAPVVVTQPVAPADSSGPNWMLWLGLIAAAGAGYYLYKKHQEDEMVEELEGDVEDALNDEDEDEEPETERSSARSAAPTVRGSVRSKRSASKRSLSPSPASTKRGYSRTMPMSSARSSRTLESPASTLRASQAEGMIANRKHRRKRGRK